MEKEGIWVRCGHCKHEFFQENPSFKALRQSQNAPEKSQERGRGASSAPDLPEDDSAGAAAHAKKSTPEKKSGGKAMKAALKSFLLFIITCLLAAACLWSYMQISGIKIQDIVSTLPYLDKIIDADDPSVLKLTQIKIFHLKQRYVKNWILGNVLVVEGTAWNSASFPVARVMVVAALYDADGRELARKEAFAGNILTPVELSTLPEEAMERELSLSHGRDTSNDRIESHGNIPFMIVFTKNYPEVAKTKVYIAGTERLLAD
jgi:hypothetical protein